jgi:hypothetical protein
MKRIDEWSVTDSIDELVKDTPTPGGNLDGINYQLRKAEIKIQQEQIRIARSANELNEQLLLSNEQASKDNKSNAESINKATKQLANSTKWLTIATFVLVFFAAVQALIAFIALYKK